MKKLLFLLLCIITADAYAQSSDFNIKEFYPVDALHSYVGFEIKYMGYAKVKGRFSDFSGTFRYNPNNLTSTSVSFIVDVASIDTDMDFRDRDLKSANWFDAEKFPKMTFQSRSVREMGNGLQVTGDLTIKDVTKQVTFNMDKGSGLLKDTRGDSQVIFTGELTINRKDYGVAGERWSAVREGITSVDSEVVIEISLLGKQFNERNATGFVSRAETAHGKLYQLITNDGVEAGLAEFDRIKSSGEMRVGPSTLQTVGYVLLVVGKTKESIAVLKHNVSAYPDEADAYDAYAEALAADGKLKEAKKNYEIALQKDPGNYNAKEILRHLE